MAKNFADHFAVNENIHKATKSVAVENKIEINELVETVLLTDPRIKSAYDRIGGN